MIHIHCPVCAIRYFVGTGAISRFYNTDDGPVAEMTCPSGHELIHLFRSARTAAVVA